MTHDTPREFGTYFRQLRQERSLGVRELARKANLNPSGLTRLEQGKRSPMPETIRALASALDVPASELFAAAGYMKRSELPNMNTYLRVCYGDVSDETIALVEKYIRHLMDERSLDPNGPANYEDETEKPSKE